MKKTKFIENYLFSKEIRRIPFQIRDEPDFLLEEVFIAHEAEIQCGHKFYADRFWFKKNTLSVSIIENQIQLKCRNACGWWVLQDGVVIKKYSDYIWAHHVNFWSKHVFVKLFYTKLKFFRKHFELLLFYKKMGKRYIPNFQIFIFSSSQFQYDCPKSINNIIN